MTWNDEQFFLERDPEPPSADFKKALGAFGAALQQAATVYVNVAKQAGKALALEQLAKKSDYTLWPPAEEQAKREGIKTRHDRPQRFRENPPHWQAQQYAYDKKGRKRY